MPDLQQKYYDAVAEELARKFLKPGLWARAMAEAGSEDAHARAAYIRLRVAELTDEEASQSPPPIIGTPAARPLPAAGKSARTNRGAGFIFSGAAMMVAGNYLPMVALAGAWLVGLLLMVAGVTLLGVGIARWFSRR